MDEADGPAHEMLDKAGIKDDDIHAEEFSGY